jgi:hypothetical protein
MLKLERHLLAQTKKWIKIPGFHIKELFEYQNRQGFRLGNFLTLKKPVNVMINLGKRKPNANF